MYCMLLIAMILELFFEKYFYTRTYHRIISINDSLLNANLN